MPTFDEALRALHDCNPRDEEDQREVRRWIVELRDHVEEGPYAEYAVSLDAALHLTRLFEKVDESALTDLMAMISGLVAFTRRAPSQAARQAAAMPQAAPVPASPMPAGPIPANPSAVQGLSLIHI